MSPVRTTTVSPPRPARVLAALLTIALLGAVAMVLLHPSAARAAGLQQVTGFGSNPGALTMYSYRPDGLPAAAPLVVQLHGCTQDATTYFTNSGWRQMADRYGFALVLAQQSTANNSSRCFNWFQAGDTSRGQGEVASIAQMVDHAVASHSLDASRVYVTGLSAGAAMTAAMLATYPDRFAGGSINAGLPYRCATSTMQAYSCMNPGVDKTPAAWGDLVRSAHPSFSGPRPAVSIWHGTSDTTVTGMNATELRDQFTNVAGVSQTPTSTGTITTGVTWEDHAASVRVTRVQGMGHGTAVDPGTADNQCGTAGAYFIDTVCAAYYDVLFFGLDDTTPGPSPSATPTATPTPTPTPTATPTCITSSNYDHVVAGRAYQSGGYTYAKGSNQYLGLYNTYYTATLKQTGADYWVIC